MLLVLNFYSGLTVGLPYHLFASTTFLKDITNTEYLQSTTIQNIRSYFHGIMFFIQN